MKYKNLYIILLGYILSIETPTQDIYNDSWALVIGINKYDNMSELHYAVEDALAIKDLLINEYYFPEENVSVLIDEEATEDNIRKALNQIIKYAQQGDRVVFYFAGHGETENLAIEDGDMGFLIPVDGDLDNKYFTSIPMHDLKVVSKMVKAKHMLFMVDACYGGLAAQTYRGLIDTDIPNYIEKVANEISRQIITAGDEDEKVIEKDDWEHSAFTKNILSGLKEQKADRNQDGVITGSELGDYIIETVLFDTENAQTPQNTKFTSDDGEIIFAIYEENILNQKKDDDLQKMINEIVAEQIKSQIPKNTTETVIVPGSRGFYISNSKEFIVEDVYYSPGGLSYRGKLKLDLEGMTEEDSWSQTVCLRVKDVLVMETSKTGQYNYSTGMIVE